jgi:hypothetical protein
LFALPELPPFVFDEDGFRPEDELDDAELLDALAEGASEIGPEVAVVVAVAVSVELVLDFGTSLLLWAMTQFLLL